MAETYPGAPGEGPIFASASWTRWYPEAFTYEGEAAEFVVGFDGLPSVLDFVWDAVENRLYDALLSKAQEQGVELLWASVERDETSSWAQRVHYRMTLRVKSSIHGDRLTQDAGAAALGVGFLPLLIPLIPIIVKGALILIGIALTAVVLERATDFFHGRPVPLIGLDGRPLVDPRTGRALYGAPPGAGQGLLPNIVGSPIGAIALLAVVALAIWASSRRGGSPAHG